MLTNETLTGKITIHFNHVERSPALEERIYEKASHLLKVHHNILNCQVTVDCPHQHKTKGNLYQVRLIVKMPGEDIVINKQPGGRIETHTDPYIAVNDAFSAAENFLHK